MVVFPPQPLYLNCFVFCRYNSQGLRLEHSCIWFYSQGSWSQAPSALKGTCQKRVFKALPKTESLAPAVILQGEEPCCLLCPRFWNFMEGDWVGWAQRLGDQGGHCAPWQWLNEMWRARPGCGLCGCRGRTGFWISLLLIRSLEFSSPAFFPVKWRRLRLHVYFSHRYINFTEFSGHDGSMNPALPELMGWHK